eukprot:TRINITY_DN20966_c0_g1_i1.p1 TRINITY_DN20966_c0_g1~~TRINITY_DN20966_c0_g1_i1.p1  ORF type:complete len:448 (-),score=107.58 TRINITY_DN20966_c0_g1_i1:67-1410(-)
MPRERERKGFLAHPVVALVRMMRRTKSKEEVVEEEGDMEFGRRMTGRFKRRSSLPGGNEDDVDAGEEDDEDEEDGLLALAASSILNDQRFRDLFVDPSMQELMKDPEGVRNILLNDPSIQALALKNTAFAEIIRDKGEFAKFLDHIMKQISNEDAAEDEDALDAVGGSGMSAARNLKRSKLRFAKDNEELVAEDFDEMRKVLGKIHPNLKLPATELVTDQAMDEAIRQNMNPLRKFNSLMIQNDRSRVFEGPGANDHQTVPNLIVVTGHSGFCGNLCVNGIYERYRSDFEGHPVYQKTLEKKALEDVHPVSRDKLEEWRRQSYADRWELMRSQTAVKLKRPQADPRPMALGPASGAYFLYYFNAHGGWCIGPRVGGTDVFARCPNMEAIPFFLRGWEIWDAGQHIFVQAKGLRAMKAGSEMTATSAPLPPWVPPKDFARARLKNDQW